MSKFSLNSEINLEVTARFIGKGHEQPLTGDAYLVRLYDKDIFNDDFLGESHLDDNGVAKITFTHSSFDNWNMDNKPDFYFVVYKHKKEIYKSVVLDNVDIKIIEKFKMGEGEVIDLGTFLIEG